MRILFTIIFIHIIGLLYSQNWSVFNKDYRYNYSLENESYTTVVIFADSILIQGTDTIFSLNRIAAKCDSCFFYYPEAGVADSNYVMINQPQFMQRRIVYSNYQYRFSDTSDYIIPRFLSLGNSWTFNTTRGITAQVISSTIKNIFGVNDSVNTILLSTNDSIIISKQFGIVKYPAKFGQHLYYKLRGIENKSSYDVLSLFGEKVPNYYDFFKLKPGVIHYYSSRIAFWAGSMNTHCDKHVYGKRTITSSALTSTTITNSYMDEFKGCYSNCGFTCNYNPAFFPSTYSSTTLTITNESVSTQSPETYNYYNNQIFDYPSGNNFIYVLKFGITSNNHFFKTYGESCFASTIGIPNYQYSMVYYPSIQNNMVYYGKSNESNTFMLFGETYIEGYGKVNAFFPSFESEYFYCTSAIIDGNDTLGSLAVTNIATSVQNKEKTYSSFGPNPTKDIITIYFPFESTGNTGTLEVTDIYGKTIFQKAIISGVSLEKINLQNFAQGIYFVDVKIPHFQKQYKVIKE